MNLVLRATVLLVTAWFALDASTPFVPGAFQFNADETVEAVSAPGQSTVAPASRDAGASTLDATLSAQGNTALGLQALVPSRVRLARGDRPRRQDHDRASSVPQSDPA